MAFAFFATQALEEMQVGGQREAGEGENMMGREERVCRNEMMRSGGGDDKLYGWEWSGEVGMEVMAEVMVEMVDVGVE